MVCLARGGSLRVKKQGRSGSRMQVRPCNRRHLDSLKQVTRAEVIEISGALKNTLVAKGGGDMARAAQKGTFKGE